VEPCSATFGRNRQRSDGVKRRGCRWNGTVTEGDEEVRAQIGNVQRQHRVVWRFVSEGECHCRLVGPTPYAGSRQRLRASVCCLPILLLRLVACFQLASFVGCVWWLASNYLLRRDLYPRESLIRFRFSRFQKFGKHFRHQANRSFLIVLPKICIRAPWPPVLVLQNNGGKSSIQIEI
jgi:hypothetical protein